MKPVRTHRPGEPSTPEPPDQLCKLADALQDPHVIQSGVTTTQDGRWALYVTVPADAPPASLSSDGATGIPG